MKNDKYMKIIMTVIAISLAKIAFMDTSLIQPVVASSGVQKIAICSERGSCANVSSGRLQVNDQ